MSIAGMTGIETFVWDTGSLVHAARRRRYGALLDAAGRSRVHLVPEFVLDELLRRGAPPPPHPFVTAPLGAQGTRWACTARSVAEEEQAARFLGRLMFWQSRLRLDSSSTPGVGSAWAVTLAESLGATAILHDEASCATVGEALHRGDVAPGSPGLEVRSLLGALCLGVSEGRLPSARSFSYFWEDLRSDGLALPFGPGGYARWYRTNCRT